jgi:hypothetical protein
MRPPRPASNPGRGGSYIAVGAPGQPPSAAPSSEVPSLLIRGSARASRVVHNLDHSFRWPVEFEYQTSTLKHTTVIKQQTHLNIRLSISNSMKEGRGFLLTNIVNVFGLYQALTVLAPFTAVSRTSIRCPAHAGTFLLSRVFPAASALTGECPRAHDFPPRDGPGRRCVCAGGPPGPGEIIPRWTACRLP